MTAFLTETLKILNEAAPYLLIGFFLAGVLDVLLRRFRQVTGVLTRPGARPVFLAALLGVPLPLCSCSVLPAALTLRRRGASKGTTASFLVSVPETDITSIAVTYALLGPVMAIARPVAAILTAITTGLVVDRMSPEAGTPRVAPDKSGDQAAETGPEIAHDRGQRHWLRRMLHFGFVEIFDDIVLQLILGIVIAGALVAGFRGLGLETALGGPVTTYLLMLVIGVPIYVCATASTPFALGFIAGGVSPGAALVFLLVGPATNIASLIILKREFGRKALIVYIVTLALFSIVMGVFLDVALGDHFPVGKRALDVVAEGKTGPSAATWFFVALVAASIWRKGRQWGRRRRAE